VYDNIEKQDYVLCGNCSFRIYLTEKWNLRANKFFKSNKKLLKSINAPAIDNRIMPRIIPNDQNDNCGNIIINFFFFLGFDTWGNQPITMGEDTVG